MSRRATDHSLFSFDNGYLQRLTSKQQYTCYKESLLCAMCTPHKPWENDLSTHLYNKFHTLFLHNITATLFSTSSSGFEWCPLPPPTAITLALSLHNRTGNKDIFHLFIPVHVKIRLQPSELCQVDLEGRAREGWTFYTRKYSQQFKACPH